MLTRGWRNWTMSACSFWAAIDSGAAPLSVRHWMWCIYFPTWSIWVIKVILNPPLLDPLGRPFEGRTKRGTSKFAKAILTAPVVSSFTRIQARVESKVDLTLPKNNIHYLGLRVSKTWGVKGFLIFITHTNLIKNMKIWNCGWKLETFRKPFLKGTCRFLDPRKKAMVWIHGIEI